MMSLATWIVNFVAKHASICGELSAAPFTGCILTSCVCIQMDSGRFSESDRFVVVLPMLRQVCCC